MPKAPDKTILLATDLQRSVLQAIEPGRVHPFAYMPYGYRSPGTGMRSLLAFNGEHEERPTGTYHLGKGYRQFNPVLMRFHSPDNQSPFKEGGLNPYAYCDGDPRNQIDPTGHRGVFSRFLTNLSNLKSRNYIRYHNKNIDKILNGSGVTYGNKVLIRSDAVAVIDSINPVDIKHLSSKEITKYVNAFESNNQYLFEIHSGRKGNVNARGSYFINGQPRTNNQSIVSAIQFREDLNNVRNREFAIESVPRVQASDTNTSLRQS